jgi:hypothetical protein
MGRRREYAASVEKEAEIPARILEQKCSNIWGGVHRLIENLKSFNISVQLRFNYTDK